jgi:hypothetical protein
MEQLVESKLTGKTEVLGENRFKKHYVHHKTHKTCPGIEPEPRLWDAGN